MPVPLVFVSVSLILVTVRTFSKINLTAEADPTAQLNYIQFDNITTPLSQLWLKRNLRFYTNIFLVFNKNAFQ